MNTLLFVALLTGFSLVYFILGLFASRTTKTTNDYFLAGRNLSLASVTFTLIATQLGGGMLLGTSQEAYKIGIFGILYTLGMSLGFLILGCGLASRLQSLQIATTAQIFEINYQSTALKKIASILSILTLFGLLIGQMVASRTIIISLGINNELIFILFWLFVIGHTMMGGLQSVAITDFYQVLYIIITFGGIFIYSIARLPGSLAQLIPSATQATAFLQADLSLSTAVSILLMPALFSLIEQDLAQRFFSARTKQVAAFSALLASLFLLTFALIPIYFGIQAKILGLALPANASPLIPVISHLTNDWVVAFALCGIIAAISSTADSLLCAISSNVAQDFDLGAIGLKSSLRSSQLLTLGIGLAAFIASYLVPQNIISILIGSYELSVSCLFIPLIIGYYNTNLNKNAAFGSVIAGLFGFVFFKLYPIGIPKELAALALSALGYVIGAQIKPFTGKV